MIYKVSLLGRKKKNWIVQGLINKNESLKDLDGMLERKVGSGSI